MKRTTFFGLSAAAMLAIAPGASASGYWTGHSEIIRTLLETWLAENAPLTPVMQIDPSQPVDMSASPKQEVQVEHEVGARTSTSTGLPRVPAR